MTETLVTVGKILGAHGLKGEVTVVELTDNPERFVKGSHVTAVSEHWTKELTIDSIRPANKGLLVKFSGVDDRTDAERLDKALLQVPEDELMELEEGRYWADEIIGLEVITTDGRSLGKVTGIMETGGNDVFIVGSGKQEVLIPAIEDVVVDVDIKAGKMVIEPLPGLLE